MNNGSPSRQAAMNGREPFASTHQLDAGHRQACRGQRRRDPSGPMRRSGAPEQGRRRRPRRYPAANATTTSAARPCR